MQIDENWRGILRHAWTVKILGFAAILSGIEVIVPVIGYRWPLPDLWRVIIYFAITAAVFDDAVCRAEKAKKEKSEKSDKPEE